MRLPDVNVLVYSHRRDAADHVRYRQLVEEMLASDSAFALSDVILSGFVRVVTHPKVFREPTPMAKALSFVRDLRQSPNAFRAIPGPRHWEVFERLCGAPGVRGNLVPDAFLAALAIESGLELITADRDFARFPGLRWRHPLDGG